MENFSFCNTVERDQAMAAHRGVRKKILLILALMVLIGRMIWSFWFIPVNPFESLYNSSKVDSCQETKILPFEVGCPESRESCHQWRRQGRPTNSSSPQKLILANESLEDDKDYYRITVAWSFGQPRLQNATLPQVGTFYEMGYNYESVSEEFINAFGHSSDFLETQIMTKMVPTTEGYHLNARRQSSMHLALCYLCCLTEEEAYHTREVLYHYVKRHHPINTPVGFDHVECWRERGNSVTTIVVADDASQTRLYREYQRVVDTLEKAGIPMVVPRTEQMPFHMTLMGFDYGGSTADWKAHHTNVIEPILPRVYQVLQNVSRQFWVKQPQRHNGVLRFVSRPQHPHFVITNDAKFSSEPEKHTRPTKKTP